MAIFEDGLTGAGKEERKLKERFGSALERAGDVLEQQPGRLLKAQQIGEQRLRQGTQKALASQMGPGSVGAGQLGALADVGATRGLAEAEFEVKSEQAISDAALRAAQGDAEIASALQSVGDAAKIREIGMQIVMLRAAGATSSEIREYIAMETAASGSAETRSFLQEQEDLGGSQFLRKAGSALTGGLTGGLAG